MVLGAQLMTKTTNKSTTYFQGVTVIISYFDYCMYIIKNQIKLLELKGRYTKMKCDLDSFLDYFAVVRVINLNKDDWAKSKCSCGWFMKNFIISHLFTSRD